MTLSKTAAPQIVQVNKLAGPGFGYISPQISNEQIEKEWLYHLSTVHVS